MMRDPNSKIVGAFVIGFALVAGAYTASNFATPTKIQPASVVSSEAPPRVAIAVSDSDQNGIEDWRDEFVTTEPIVITSASTTDFEFPTTYTGRLGIDLLEGVLMARSAGPFGQSKEEVIEDTLNQVYKETSYSFYSTKDLSIMQRWTDADIKNYANAMAGAILSVNPKELQNEIDILDEVLNNGDLTKLEDLKTIAKTYQSLRDSALVTPVPAILAKQHLDLTNTYHAMYKDVDAMTLSVEDPLVALLSIKRYQDNALGLELALQNMYRALEPHARLFASSDPAIYFTTFNPANQRVN